MTSQFPIPGFNIYTTVINDIAICNYIIHVNAHTHIHICVYNYDYVFCIIYV